MPHATCNRYSHGSERSSCVRSKGHVGAVWSTIGQSFKRGYDPLTQTRCPHDFYTGEGNGIIEPFLSQVMNYKPLDILWGNRAHWSQSDYT